MSHVPVLLHEVIEALDPKPGHRYIDATANGGGHTDAFARAGAKILAIEWDEELARKLKIQMPNVEVVNDNYANIGEIAKLNDFENCDGILFDLGFSSWQIEEAGRGLSFMRDEFLDMRYHTGSGQTALDLMQSSRRDRSPQSVGLSNSLKLFEKRSHIGIGRAGYMLRLAYSKHCGLR